MNSGNKAAPGATMKITHILTATSECGTYRETLRCISAAEAEGYAARLREDGWKCEIKPAA